LPDYCVVSALPSDSSSVSSVSTDQHQLQCVLHSHSPLRRESSTPESRIAVGDTVAEEGIAKVSGDARVAVDIFRQRVLQHGLRQICNAGEILSTCEPKTYRRQAVGVPGFTSEAAWWVWSVPKRGGTLSPPHQWVSVGTSAIDFYFRSHFETLETVGNSFKATGKVSVENTLFDHCLTVSLVQIPRLRCR
jgi:hypothetical protein